MKNQRFFTTLTYLPLDTKKISVFNFSSKIQFCIGNTRLTH